MGKQVLSTLICLVSIGANAQISRYDLNFDQQVDSQDVVTLVSAVLNQHDSLKSNHQRLILHSAGDSIYLPTSRIDDIAWTIGGNERNLTLHDTIEQTINDTLTQGVTHYVTTLIPEKRVCYQQEPIKMAKEGLSNVNFIPIFGQSLGVGCAAVPIVTPTCKYKSAIMFNTGVRNARVQESALTSFVPLHESEDPAKGDKQPDGETCASGCAEMLTELFELEEDIDTDDDFWDDHKFLFAEFGYSGKRIAELMKTSSTKVLYYDGLVNGVKAAKRICDENGLTLNVPCFMYIQGEADQSDNVSCEYYADSLSALRLRFNKVVKEITGQENEVSCILHQLASQNLMGKSRKPKYGDQTMNVPLVEMEFIRDSTEFRGSTPIYILDHSTIEPAHLTGVGEKLFGAYFGRSIFQLLKGRPSPALLMQDVKVVGNSVIVTFNDSITIDTSYVNEVENYGFTIINQRSAHIISSVKVSGNYVILNCKESPAGGTLYYGFNGERGYDGREHGSRGNIHTAGPTDTVFTIEGRTYPLYDYLHSFYTQL